MYCTYLKYNTNKIIILKLNRQIFSDLIFILFFNIMSGISCILYNVYFEMHKLLLFAINQISWVYS